MNFEQIKTSEQIDSYSKKSYKFGFVTDLESERPAKGLNEDTIKFISQKKKEPEWMLNWRLQAFDRWKKMAEPTWANISPFQILIIKIFIIMQLLKDLKTNLNL